MTVRSDVLFHFSMPADAEASIILSTTERWIVKWWTWWADDDVTVSPTRMFIQQQPAHDTGVGMYFDATNPGVAHTLFINGRADHLAPQQWWVVTEGSGLHFVIQGGNGHWHLNVSGARLQLP